VELKHWSEYYEKCSRIPPNSSDVLDLLRLRLGQLSGQSKTEKGQADMSTWPFG